MKTFSKMGKSIFSVLLIFSLIIVSACSSTAKTTESSNAPQDTQAAPEVSTGKPVKVKLFASPGGNIVDLNTNWFTKYAQKEFNLKIDWDIAPNADRDTKQSLLIASGDYPDAFWSGNFNTSDIQKYAKQGILIPLNDLIDEYGPNIKKAMEEESGVKDIMVAPDGKIYGIPNVNWCMHCNYSAKMWINTKLLDKYNLKMPTTTDEFENVLEVFKKNGIIPLTGETDGWHGNPVEYLMNAFTYNDTVNYFQVDDGKVSFAPVKTEWRDGLKYVNNLYKKGLLDNQAFSQKNEAVMRLVSQDKVGAVAWGVSNGFIPNGSADPNYVNWRTVPALKGPQGKQYAAFFGNGYGSIAFAMTKKSTKEQQIAMIKFMNYVYTAEGTQVLDFGEEGKFWKKAKEGDKGLDGKQALFDTAWNTFYAADAKQNEGWDQMGPIFQSREWRDGGLAVPPFSTDGLSTLLQLETMKDYAGHQPPQVYPAAAWVPESDNQQYALYKTNINKYVTQWMTQFVFGNKSLDKDWESYIKGFDDLGLTEYLAISQKAMIKPFDTSLFKADPESVQFLSSLK